MSDAVLGLLDRMAYVLAYHAEEIPEVEGPFGPEADWKWILDRARDNAYWGKT